MTEQEEFEFRMRMEQEQAAHSAEQPLALSAPQESAVAPQPPTTPPDRLKGRNWLERGTLGAGKAVADLMDGVGLGGVLWPRGWQRAPGADNDLMSDPVGIGGNIAGQVGIGVLGGSALQAGGRALQAASVARALPAIKTAGGLLETAGNAVINPATYKQAAGAGAAFGALTQPGDLPDRLQNSIIGGIGGAGGLAIGRGIGSAASGVLGGVKSLITPRAPIEMQISAKLSGKGIDYSSLPQAVKDQIVSIGKRSIDDVDKLDGAQLGRMADFNALGIKPTRGWVTRDAKDWWMENNLNTVDDQIASRFKDANQSLLQGVNKGVGNATDYQRGKVLQDSVTGYDSSLKSKADELYNAARNTAGRDIPLDPHRFVNNASIDLDQQMLGSKLPADTLSWFQKATEGKEPFDMGTAMQRLQALNGRIYSTNDKAEAKALGIVKKHLIDAIDNGGISGFRPTGRPPMGAADIYPASSPGGPQLGGPGRLLEGGGQRGGQDLMSFQGGLGPATGGQPGAQEAPGIADAFRAARTAAADRFRFQESNPLIDKILKGRYASEQLPDLVGRMKVDDLNSLSQLEKDRGVPIMGALRDAARSYVQDAATLQGETGGSFTVNGMRKALDKIGPEKGVALFGKDGWADYQRILRAAGNINNAPMKPAGSTTAPNLLRMLQQLPIPGIPQSLNLVVSGVGKVKQMSNVGAALNPTMKVNVPRTAQPSMLPLIAAPGLLSISQ